MTDWLRLWHDMPTDPKWRAIARKSGQPLACVIALFNLLLVNASANAASRGSLSNWSDEDAAAALDMDEDAVAAIMSAMEGKVIENNRLTGWDKRQPKREDGTAAERKEAWKQRQIDKRNALERSGTQRNAPETDTDTDTELQLTSTVEVETLACGRAGSNSADIETRKAVIAAYREAGSATIPDTSRVPMWIERGFTQTEIVAVIREKLATGSVPTTLKWFDGALADLRRTPPERNTGPPSRKPKSTTLELYAGKLRAQANGIPN